MSQYATTGDFTALGLPAAALDGFTGSLDALLIAASGTIDSYLRGRYKLPLTAPYPQEIVTACVVIAAWMLLAVRGFDPGSGPDATVRTRYEDLVSGRPLQKSWLQMLSEGKVNLDLAADATAGVHEGGPIVSAGARARSSGGFCGARAGSLYNFWGQRGDDTWC